MDLKSGRRFSLSLRQAKSFEICIGVPLRTRTKNINEDNIPSTVRSPLSKSYLLP